MHNTLFKNNCKKVAGVPAKIILNQNNKNAETIIRVFKKDIAPHTKCKQKLSGFGNVIGGNALFMITQQSQVFYQVHDIFQEVTRYYHYFDELDCL